MSTSKHTRYGARIVRACAAGIGLALAAAPLAAQEPVQQREHTVRRGDTLWDLARAYLSNPFLWPAIYEVNRGTVRDPHWIYPTDRLIIPGMLPPAVTGGAEVAQAGRAGPAGGEWQTPAPSRFAREPGAGSSATLQPAQEAPRQLVRAAEYRATPWLADSAAVGVRARIAALVDPADAGDRMPTTLRPRDRVYLGALAGASPAPGDSLLVVRFGRAVGGFGQIVQPLGVLFVDSMPGGVPSATLVRQFGDARVGDAVIALGAVPALPSAQQPAAGAAALEGMLLQFVELHAMYGAAGYGFVDLGQGRGVAIGDELSVYVPARPAEPHLPATAIATVRVIRVESGTATVRVVGLSSTALAPGLPVRLVRRAS